MTRPAGDVGAGLDPVRPGRMLLESDRVHVVGVAGAGASAAALLAAAAGAKVSGCDQGGPSPYTEALDAAGIAVEWRHDAMHLREPWAPTRLAVTKALTAIQPDHPELVAARAAGIPVESWQQTVADAAVGRRLVGVAGTHGKSTSAGWLVHVLSSAGRDPSAFVGALLPAALTGGTPATARIGTGPEFVVEADEYAGNFDAYRPEVAVLTSVEWDHPDVFANLDAVIAAFGAWLGMAALATSSPILVANVADPAIVELVRQLAGWPGRLLPVGLVPAPTTTALRAARDDLVRSAGSGAAAVGGIAGRILSGGPAGTQLEVIGLAGDEAPLTMTVGLAGRHNAANALGVAATAHALGLSPDEVTSGIASFGGVGRRLELVGRERDVAVYDDYGHHPSAIRATLEAVRQREPGRRIWAVYEPLTYHRTAALLVAFAEALAEADGVAIADIWAGRDPDLTVASAAGLATQVRRVAPGIPVEAPGSVESTADWLAGVVQPGDAVLVMGGGRSYRIGPLLIERLARG